jgi:hypothetical protein
LKNYTARNAELLHSVKQSKTQKNLSLYQFFDDVLEANNDFDDYDLNEMANISEAEEVVERFQLRKLEHLSEACRKGSNQCF